MRKYDDPVEVQRGMVSGAAGQLEGPTQFLWRGKLWKVVEVVAHWVETGPWWQSAQVAPVFGAESDPGSGAAHDLMAEREVWRVQAGRGQSAQGAQGDQGAQGYGVFDLVFDWAQGGWQLSRCAD